MPRGKKAREGSSYKYFQELFTRHPKLLQEKSNDEIFARYRSDHLLPADAAIERPVINNMSNLKSKMRKHIRDNEATQAAANGTPLVRSSNQLEILEEMIDDCLTIARKHDREEMQEVIHLLRRARNRVVFKLGEQ